mgnify:CR=1 FL=1
MFKTVLTPLGYIVGGLLVCYVLLYVVVICRSGWPVYDRNGKKLPGPTVSDYYLKFGRCLYIMVSNRYKKQFSKGFEQLINEVGDGNMCAMTINELDIVVVGHPDLAKLVMAGHFSKFPKAPRYERMKFALGEGLVTASGQKWQTHRHHLNIAFNAGALRQMTVEFNRYAHKMMAVWKGRIDLEGLAKTKTGDAAEARVQVEVDLNKDLSYLTLCVICQTGFGYELPLSVENDQFPVLNEFSRVSADVELLLNEINARITDPSDFFYLLRNNDKVNEALSFFQTKIDDIVSERKSQRGSPAAGATAGVVIDKNTAEQKDLLDLVLSATDDGCNMSATDIRDHITTFLAAGHETTSTTLLWICYELSQRPDVQRRCQAEVDALLKSKDKGADGTIDNLKLLFEDLNGPEGGLNYVQAVIKETLRLHAPVGGFGKYCTEDFKYKDYTIKANTTFLVSSAVIHTHPQFWKDPLDFQPERFLPENIKETIHNPFMYIPFSAGPRNCIGQRFANIETMVILVHILSYFNLVPLSKQQLADIRYEETVTSQPKNFKCHIELRNQ